MILAAATPSHNSGNCPLPVIGTQTSGGQANFQINVTVTGDQFPLTVDVSDSTDLVTGGPPDLPLVVAGGIRDRGAGFGDGLRDRLLDSADDECRRHVAHRSSGRSGGPPESIGARRRVLTRIR